MKPLRNTVLIERLEHVSEEMTESGLYIMDGKSLDNFSEFEEAMSDIVFKKPFQKNDLTSKLIEHSKKKHGIHDIAKEEKENKVYDEKVKNIINRDLKNYGRVVESGSDANYYQPGDLIYFRGQSEILSYSKDGKEYVLVAEKNVLAKEMGSKLIPNPDFVLIKITKESRESLFRKRIIRDDGTPALLFITVDENTLNDRKAEIFVSGGQVIEAGANVENVLPDDTAIIHYLVDNNDDIIVGYDGADKLVVVDAITTRHEDDNIVHENRKGNRTQAVWFKGDYDNLSSLIAVVRDSNIHPREPFVLLEHKSNVVGKVTRSGLIYYETEMVIEREVLSVAKESTENYDIVPGMKVLVNDFDVFSVMIDGKKFSCINDVDVLARID